MENLVLDFLKKIAIEKFGDLYESNWNENKFPEINFRCPICGDSKTNKSKSRFWFNLEKNLFNCFNCFPRYENGNTIKKLIEFFPNINNFDYISLNKYIEEYKIYNYLSENKDIRYINIKKENVDIEFPNGCRLDILLDDDYEKILPDVDLNNLKIVINFLDRRKINKEFYKYFYFVFIEQSDSKYKNLYNYILNLVYFEKKYYWSGRLLNNNKYFQKYLNCSANFSKILSFDELIDEKKGEYIFINEGFYDALILNQCGFNSMSVFSINNMNYTHDILSRYRKNYKLVWIPDNDQSIIRFLDINKKFHFNMDILILENYKDVNDFYIQDYENFVDKFKNMVKYNIYKIGDYLILNDLKRLMI